MPVDFCRGLDLDNHIRDFTKTTIEELLFRLGFEPAVVKLIIDAKHKELKCYKRNELHCLITFTQLPAVHGELKEWVLIEYADSLDCAERLVFDDGDMIPLDIPMKQIIFELEAEILQVIKFAV